MSETERVCSLKDMKRIARYEITFRDLADESLFNTEYVTEGVYPFTLEDLACALKNLREKNPFLHEFGEVWYYPLTLLNEWFAIEKACTVSEDNPYAEYAPLKWSDAEYFREIWDELDEVWTLCDPDSRISEVMNLDEWIAECECHLSNAGKPVAEWAFTDLEKTRFIAACEPVYNQKAKSENALALCRKFIEELIPKDNVTALRTKGYACYGGSRLYDCDWYVSRDCMERLFELTDDAGYANTLGYIYYYGRCTHGTPEYEIALKYFMIAAANGYYESAYKLADMYVHGYGTKKSLKTARVLYSMVYDDTRSRFLRGENSNFADAALRMGNVFAKGIGEEQSDSVAYKYYLEALYAAKLRLKDSDFFGDSNVVIHCEKALEDTRKKLDDSIFKEYIEYRYPFIFALLCADNCRCTLSVSRKDDGWFEVTAKRCPTRSVPEPESILLTLPALSYCQRTDQISLLTDPSAEFFFTDYRDQMKFDFCDYDPVHNRYEFFNDDEMIAYVKAEEWRFYGQTPVQKQGKQYCIVSIRFHENGRIYDYLSDITDISAGDHVIVEGYDGETEVTVADVKIRYESELSLPPERYRKIVRKI